MHNHLVPASYHRVISVGSPRRLVNGEKKQSIITTMTACIINVENQDKKVHEGLMIMEENAGLEYKSLIRVIIQWQTQTYLKQAKDSLRITGISFPSESEHQINTY